MDQQHLVNRGGVWYVRMRWRGKRYLRSTACTDSPFHPLDPARVFGRDGETATCYKMLLLVVIL